jgi:protein TonB
MTRVFPLIVLLAFASMGAADARAQSRRVYRVEPPKEERAKETETKDAPKDDSASDAEDTAKDKPQDGAQAGGDTPVTVKEVTTRAVVKSKPQPIFPSEARRRGLEGTVKLRIILGSDGKVREKMQVLEGLPYGMTEQAMKAALRIEFEPARKDGRPVSQYVVVMYHFNLY